LFVCLFVCLLFLFAFFCFCFCFDIFFHHGKQFDCWP
jgi:hypothetical protein